MTDTEQNAAETTAPKKARARPARKVKTPTAKAPAPAKTAKTVKTPATKAAPAPKEPQTNSHVDAGINVRRYTGPSSFVNSNRKPKILLGRTKAASKLTSRAQAGFYALRECYGENSFRPRGFDNGVLRDLLGANLIRLTGGQEAQIDGSPYRIDGSSPVVVHITAEGLRYGRA